MEERIRRRREQYRLRMDRKTPEEAESRRRRNRKCLRHRRAAIPVEQRRFVFGVLFLQSISINHLVPSKHIFTIIYGNILKLILISSILAHFTIHVLVLTATREIKQLILSSHQIQINIYLSIVDRLSYIIFGLLARVAFRPSVFTVKH